MDQISNAGEPTKPIELDAYARATLLETAKWTRLLGIVAIVSLLVFSVLFLAVMYVSLKESDGFDDIQMAYAVLGYLVLTFVIAALNFFPIFALFKYSSSVKKAISSNDTFAFYKALACMRDLFRYLGILTVIIAIFYAFVFTIYLLIAAFK